MAVKINRNVNGYRLGGVIAGEPVAFLRKLLQDANIVQAAVAPGAILDHSGAVGKEWIEEALAKLTGLLAKAIKAANAKHGAGRRDHKDPAG